MWPFILIGVFSFTSLMGWTVTQPETYHAFSDRRSLLGIPNAADVISNIAFLLVGVFGLTQSEQLRMFSLGLIAVSIGSSYYHWAPSNSTLIWDRLPMTFVMATMHQISLEGHGIHISLPYISILAMSTVGWWVLTEDLIPYLLLQMMTIVETPLILILGWNVPQAIPLLGSLLIYASAIVCEAGDHRIWRSTNGIISGHTLKHYLAGAAMYVFLTCHQ